MFLYINLKLIKCLTLGHYSELLLCVAFHMDFNLKRYTVKPLIYVGHLISSISLVGQFQALRSQQNTYSL